MILALIRRVDFLKHEKAGLSTLYYLEALIQVLGVAFWLVRRSEEKGKE